MSKYNEIMEHIELTDEMRERILSNVKAKNKRRHISKMIGGITAAAACAVIVFGAVTVMKNTGSVGKKPDKTTVAATSEATAPTVQDTLTFGATPYKNAAELSETFGVEIRDITALPFEVRSVSYSIMFDSFAEVDYCGENDEECCFRIGKDTEDISGEFDEFTSIETTEINGAKITLKGYDGKYHLASWINQGHFYSVSLSEDMDKEILLKIADEIINE